VAILIQSGLKLRRSWLFAAACVTAIILAGFIFFAIRKTPLPDRVIRIGVDHAAPYQSWAEGKGAVGFTVELLSEAAAKRNIRVQWVYRPEGPGPAFDRRNVDMWPLVSSNWISRRGVYAPPPFFENQYAIAWLSHDSAPGPIPDWNGRTIATANLPVSIEMARRAVPGLVLAPSRDRSHALQSVCEGRAEAAFMEVRLLETNLIRRPQGCGDKNFQIQFFHNLRVPMSLAAFPEFKIEADELRDEIELMFQDGRYAGIADRWFLFSTIEGHAAVALSVQRQFRVYTGLMMSIMAVLIVLLIILYRRSRQARRAAEAASRAKSEFLASVSHEIRTPMNGVLGMADLLLHGALEGSQLEYAASIAESARLQLSILNDILDSSKIESGKLSIENYPFSPEVILTDILKTYRAMAAEQHLDFTLTCDTATFPQLVLGDGRRLAQILGNLVSNAIKFTPSGSVTLSARILPIGLAGKALFRFEVVDTGIGIEIEAQKTIFDSFTQVYSGATRKYGGTGLGLNISKRLVEQMGGTLHLESQAGHGSRFWFDLVFPVLEFASGPQPPAATRSSVRAFENAPPLLIVEDNRVNQRVVRAQLDLLALRYEIASNGVDAVAKLAKGRYSVILMDCHMPEMDGWEATRRIRNLPNGQHVPIIAMTASATEEDRHAASAAGMDDFLAKPFTRAELESMLSRYIPASLPVHN